MGNGMHVNKSLAKLSCLSILILSVSGCITTTAVAGRNFDSSKINQIQKGVTKTSEIRSCYGEPYETEKISATENKWHYSWAQATARTPFVIFGSRTVETEGVKKNLWLLIKDDVVVNYTYEEGPIAPRTTVVPEGVVGNLAYDKWR